MANKVSPKVVEYLTDLKRRNVSSILRLEQEKRDIDKAIEDLRKELQTIELALGEKGERDG